MQFSLCFNYHACAKQKPPFSVFVCLSVNDKACVCMQNCYNISVGIELLSSVVLASAHGQGESAGHAHVSPLFWILSCSCHHRALGRYPCAGQSVLIRYLFHTQHQQCISVGPNLANPPPPPCLLPPWCPYVWALCLCLSFCPGAQVHLYCFPVNRLHTLMS